MLQLIVFFLFSVSQSPTPLPEKPGHIGKYIFRYLETALNNIHVNTNQIHICLKS